MTKRHIPTVFLLLLASLALSPAPFAAQAPVCALSDRIESANTNRAVGSCPAGSSHDIITLTDDITLSEPLPPVTGTITIEGGGRVISGDNKHRIFWLRGGNLTINNLRLTKGRVQHQNDLDAGGGAIMIEGGGVLTINNSIFEDNSAPDGGAIGSAYIPYKTSRPDITIKGSSFINNSSGSGGAISTIRMSGGRVSITGSSFINNRSSNGGGAVHGDVGEITLTHVPMSNNTSHENGAAIWAPGERQPYLERAKVNLYNSIITGQFPFFEDDCYGRLNESKGNLTDPSCQPAVSDEPLLEEPTGSPLHYPLQDGSPALDAADPTYCLPTDQLGNPRPQGAGCDIGAIESTNAIPAPTPIPAICPLDDQIIAANTDAAVGPCPAGAGADVIYMIRDFTLAERLPPITSDITIFGNGYTISGEDRFGLFEVDGGRLTIMDATLTKGSAGEGGAIRIRNGGAVLAENIEFVENSATAGGAIAAEHYNVRLDVTGSSFRRNRADDSGGAIFIKGGFIDIKRSAFQDNSAGLLGGALNLADGRITIANSTLSGNRAAEGGGIYASGAAATLTHLTMMNNRASQLRGGGIYKQGGLVALRNSIVAGSAPSDDCFGALDQNRGNFSGDGSCASQPGGDPLLGELTGAPGRHPPQAGSPALDAADPAHCLDSDQIGGLRPLGNGCDIGAIEYAGAARAAVARPPATAECSLADQIIAANSDAPAGSCPAGNGADTISLTQDHTLSQPLPPITSDLTIRGNGYTIDGAGRFRIFEIDGLAFDDFPHVAIKDLTLVNGSAPEDKGGAIRLRKGELVLSDLNFRNNQAAYGGAIASSANTSLKIYHSRLSSNAADWQGGALYYGGCVLVDWTVVFDQNRSSYGIDDSRLEITIARDEWGHCTAFNSGIHFRTAARWQ